MEVTVSLPLSAGVGDARPFGVHDAHECKMLVTSG